MDEALPLSFERSAEKGIDLNSALGNALAASIHAILQDAMVVTLEVGRLSSAAFPARYPLSCCCQSCSVLTVVALSLGRSSGWKHRWNGTSCIRGRD